MRGLRLTPRGEWVLAIATVFLIFVAMCVAGAIEGMTP